MPFGVSTPILVFEFVTESDCTHRTSVLCTPIHTHSFFLFGNIYSTAKQREREKKKDVFCQTCLKCCWRCMEKSSHRRCDRKEIYATKHPGQHILDIYSCDFYTLSQVNVFVARFFKHCTTEIGFRWSCIFYCHVEWASTSYVGTFYTNTNTNTFWTAIAATRAQQ